MDELDISFIYIEILSFAQQYFHGEFMSPATFKHTWVFM